MNIKRYLGKTANEAMARVKQDMGSEAIILHTRKIKQKGIKGWFAKPMIEVMAAIEEKPVVQPSNQLQETLRQTVRQAERKDVEPYVSEIGDLKAQVDTLTQLVEGVMQRIERVPSAQREDEAVSRDDDFDSPVFEHLQVQMVKPAIIDVIKARVREQLSDASPEHLQVDDLTQRLICDLLGTPYQIDQLKSRRQVFFFVGPTGVGKTTTLAKIAAKLALIDGRHVALVTADTYRIAAVEQLKTYSEILSISLDVIYQADDLQHVLEKHSHADFILIDTAGKNHKEVAGHADLKELLAVVKQPEIFLVMSMTSSTKDIDSILHSYQFIDDYKIIFTKLDEAESLGNLLNARLKSNKPLAYITNGQSVPDDIAPADAERLTHMLLGDDDE